MNSTNVSNIYYTQFTFPFINGSFDIEEDAEICVGQITIPYSWFNINANVYNNASFSYRWYSTGSTYTTYTVIFPNGNYSVSDINNYLQQYFISQNQYLYNTSTVFNYFFISLDENTTYYANQLYCFPVPSSLPSGYTVPSGFVYSTLGYTPQVIFSSTNNFKSLIGYAAGTYPSSPQTSSYNTTGTTIPDLSPVNSLVLICNIVNNPVSSPTNILDTIPISDTSFGSNINYSPPYEKWISVSAGKYNEFVLSFLDQNFNVIEANDDNVLISLLLRQPKKKKTLATMIKNSIYIVHYHFRRKMKRMKGFKDINNVYIYYDERCVNEISDLIHGEFSTTNPCSTFSVKILNTVSLNFYKTCDDCLRDGFHLDFMFCPLDKYVIKKTIKDKIGVGLLEMLSQKQAII
jgi:hypothetical protein